MVLGKILALKASTAQGQRLQGLRGSPSWCFRIGEGANKLPELEGRCWLNFFVVLQGKGLVLSHGYVRIGGLFWWFLQTETRGIWRGKDGIRSIEMQCFDIDFFFSIFFLFIFSYIVEEKTSLQMPLFPTLARYTFFLAFFKFWNSSQPILLRANFWLQGNGLAHQTWFHFCPALRAAWHSFISRAWVIYQPELFLTCLRPAFHLCSSAFD